MPSVDVCYDGSQCRNPPVQELKRPEEMTPTERTAFFRSEENKIQAIVRARISFRPVRSSGPGLVQSEKEVSIHPVEAYRAKIMACYDQRARPETTLYQASQINHAIGLEHRGLGEWISRIRAASKFIADLPRLLALDDEKMRKWNVPSPQLLAEFATMFPDPDSLIPPDPGTGPKRTWRS